MQDNPYSLGCLPMVLAPKSRHLLIEKYGAFDRTITDGCGFVIPFGMERVAYDVDMREIMIEVDKSHSILKDNVTVSAEGVAFIRILDAEKVV